MKHASLKSIPLTHVQAARYLGISRTVLARLADTGKIPYYTAQSQGQRRHRSYLVDDLKAYRDAAPPPPKPKPIPLSTPPLGYVDTTEVAQLMGISRSGVLKAVAAGRLPGSIKQGRFRFFAKADIDRFVKVPSDQGLLDLSTPSAPWPSVADFNIAPLISELREIKALLVTLNEKWS